MHEGSPPESLKPLKYRRFRRSVPVKKHARSSLDGRRRISVPCPHDPCPDLASRNMGPFFVEKKKAPAATYPQVKGFQKYGGLFAGKKRRLRQRTHKLGASRNMGPFFAEKKAPAATYPQVKGFQKFGPLGIQAEKQGFRTAWLITGQKFPQQNLKSGSSLLTFRDLSSHICQILMRIAR